MVPSNNMAQTLEGVNYTIIDGTWNIKNEIIAPKFYELLINT